MSVNGTTFNVNNTRYYTSPFDLARQLRGRFAKQKLDIRPGTEPPKEPSGGKIRVSIVGSVLQKAAVDSEFSDNLDSRLAAVEVAQKTFEAINDRGYDIEVRGYAIDRNGTMRVLGKEKNSGKEFDIKLGNVRDSSIDVRETICKYFGVSVSEVFFEYMSQ